MIIPQAGPSRKNWNFTHYKELAELFWSQTRQTKNGVQGAAIQGQVVRHDDLAEWVLTAQNNVASHLADN